MKDKRWLAHSSENLSSRITNLGSANLQKKGYQLWGAHLFFHMKRQILGSSVSRFNHHNRKSHNILERKWLKKQPYYSYFISQVLVVFVSLCPYHGLCRAMFGYIACSDMDYWRYFGWFWIIETIQSSLTDENDEKWVYYGSSRWLMLRVTRILSIGHIEWRWRSSTVPISLLIHHDSAWTIM